MRKQEVEDLIVAGTGSTSHRRRYGPYLFIFFVAVAARTFFFIIVDDPILFTKYPFFAEKIAAGEDIGERLVDLSPFYLYFLVWFKKILSLDWHVLKILQSLVGVLNCLLVLAVGTRVFRKSVGVVAALLFGLYGNMIVLESTLEPTVFVLFFNLLTLFFLVKLTSPSAGEDRYRTIALGAGLFAGLSAITKPNFLLFFPLAGMYILFFRRKERPLGKRIGYAAIFVLTGCAIIGTVTVRNYMALDDFVLVTADAGKVFFHGSGRGATALEGTGLVDEGFSEEGAEEPDYAHVLYRKRAEALTGESLQPSESSKFWFKRTLMGIMQDPLSYIRLEAKKLFYFFNDYEMHYIASAYKEYKTLLSFPLVRYGMISCLALVGMGLSLRGSRKPVLVFGIVFVYLLSCLLFLVQSRYRTPAVPYLCMFAGYGLVVFTKMFTAKRYLPLALGLLALTVSCGFAHMPYGNEVAVVDKWQQATKVHYQMGGRRLFDRGRYHQALEELGAAVELAPGFTPAYNLRGKIHGILGNYDQAARDFKMVIALSPEQAKGYKNLGFLAVLQRQEDRARKYLSQALALGADDEKISRTLEKLKGS